MLLIKGFVLGAGMIVPIGAQNAFVLNQGIKQNYHLMTATICCLCDIALIFSGIWGGGAFFASDPKLLFAITLAGSGFLLSYGALSIKSAWQTHNSNSVITLSSNQTRSKVLLSALSVTLLNPHVYLDTVVVIGSISSQYPFQERLLFASGMMLASLIWFYTLALSAAKMALFLSRAKVKAAIDFLVALMMFFIAAQLLLTLYR
jgi:L-lysine exporter family protein LysE/ArgO